MTDVDPRKLAQGERVLCWSVRACVTSLAVTVAALVLALADMGGGDQTILAAVGLFVCFVGVFFALTGLFGLALARETPTLRPPPAWMVPASVIAIIANFALGMFGLLHLRFDVPDKKYTETIQAEGHLIDSQHLNHIFDKVIERGAAYEVLRFDIGKTNDDKSFIQLKLTANSPEVLRELLKELVPFGAQLVDERDARFEVAPKDHCVPFDFYSTTNHKTQIRKLGRWIEVEHQRMDAVIVDDGEHAVCRKLRDVRKGDRVMCGVDGVRVVPEYRDRERHGFAFMSNDISSERRVEVSVAKVAKMMREVREAGGKIAFVAGPVLIHTGGIEYFCDIVRKGWVDVLLSGNALAVHDIEYALYGTSLGVDLQTGSPVEEGHKNHMRAINVVNHAGSIADAVKQGVLKHGIMHDCVVNKVEFVLAGSIRDDGPLPDTLMDLIEAQESYARALEGCKMVVMLSTMLHSIGVGNMLPSWVRVVCVDINPAVVTKLADRGSAQTLGIVTDVGLFLHQLAPRLEMWRPSS